MTRWNGFVPKVKKKRSSGHAKCRRMCNPNLYPNLDMIPLIDTNGSKSRSNHTQNGLLQHYISPNGPKWSEMVKNYRKWVKISKKIL